MAATITWCGHATIRLTLPDGRVVFIDPWLSGNPACPDGLKKPARCDLIVLTHGHGDHIGDVGALSKKFSPPIVGNFELCTALEKTVGKGDYRGMNTGGTQTVNGISVTLTQALHSSSVDTPNGPMYAGMPNGVVVAVEGLPTVYHAGDTDVFMDMKLIAQLLAPDICILPIGDHFTMGARGAALAAEMLQPKVIIPLHYRTFPVLASGADAFRRTLPQPLRERLVVAEVGQEVPWAVPAAR
ncbi:MAG TPA: metal-dependent hydrolase [Phycisphaerae bacterium]|nr:metal-dependent hydrolase [Phycisphaerae bacterium]HNU45408.1 metal-dependent hydrolase [Phycisphaerae bacterium]